MNNKSMYKFLFIGICLFCVLFMNNAQIKANAEPQNLFTIPWGDGENEAGLIKGPELEIAGALSFCLSGDNILILDTPKLRVLQASKEGKLSVKAQDAKIWSITPDGSDGFFGIAEDSIHHFASTGYHDKTFNIPQKVKVLHGYGTYLEFSKDKLFFNNVDQKSALAVQGNAKAGFKESDQAAAQVFKGRKGSSDELSYYIKRFSANDVRLYGADAEEKNIVAINIKLDSGYAGAVLFKGQDEKGNLYVEVERIADGKTKLEVHRYSKSGERLAVIEMPNAYYSTVYKKTEVSPDGSVYQMQTTPEGIKFIRY